MYWPGRARSLCRLKPYPLDPRWITQRRGRSSVHTSWKRPEERKCQHTRCDMHQQTKTLPYLRHGCLFRKYERHKDYGELLWFVNHEYKAEVEHTGGCCMLMCCAVCFWQSWVNSRLFGVTWSPNSSPGRKRVSEACDWRSAGKGLWRIWGGAGGRQPEAVSLTRLWPCRLLRKGPSSGVVREPCSLQAPTRTMEAGRWPLTTVSPPSPHHVQSRSGMAGRVRAVLSSRKKLEDKPRNSLPLYGWSSFFI